MAILIGGGVADVGGDPSREGFDGQQPLVLGGFGGRGWVGGGPEGPGLDGFGGRGWVGGGPEGPGLDMVKACFGR